MGRFATSLVIGVSLIAGPVMAGGHCAAGKTMTDGKLTIAGLVFPARYRRINHGKALFQ